MVGFGQQEMGAESSRCDFAAARSMTAFAANFSDIVRDAVKNQQNLRGEIAPCKPKPDTQSDTESVENHGKP
jgi:hypothetical protein